MGVPILRLPFLALKVLVDHFNRVELITVALLSKRADRILKFSGKKNLSFFNLKESDISDLCDFQKLELLLLESSRQGELSEWDFKFSCSVSFELLISICCTHFNIPIYIKPFENIKQFVGVRRNLRIGDLLVPVVVTEENYKVEKITTFWSCETDGMIRILDFFKNNFNLPIEELKLAGKDSKVIRTVVNHIKSSQIVVRNVLVGSYPPLSDDDFEFILKNVTATESFTSHLVLSQNFKFSGTIRAKNIDIQDGHWFTIQNLLESNENEVIYVRSLRYKNQELRTFLEEWKSGRFPKLKEVNLATWVSYSHVTRAFLERWDKCVKYRGRQVEAFRGHGDSYGTVNPTESGQGYFRMRFYNFLLYINAYTRSQPYFLICL